MAVVDEKKAYKALDREFNKWLMNPDGSRKSELDIEWGVDVETDQHIKWTWKYKGKTYIWKFQYYTGKVNKIKL